MHVDVPHVAALVPANGQLGVVALVAVIPPAIGGLSERRGPLQQCRLKWGTVPNSNNDEMVKLIVTDLGSIRRHGLNSLACLGRSTGNLECTHPRPKRPQ
jgi:hypothetical protein